jgi:predicted RND superfamily exporter protein
VHAALERIVRFVMQRRVGVLLVVMLISVAAAGVLPRASLGSSLRSMFFGDHHAGFNDYLQRIEKFGSDEVYMFGLEVSEPLAEPTLRKLRRFHELAEARDDVRRVSSVANLQRVGLVGETIGVRKFAEEAAANPDRAGPLLDEIRDDPIAGGLMVARDSDDVLVLVEMIPDPTRKAETGPEKIAAFLTAFEDAGFDRDQIHQGGMVAVLAEMINVSKDNLLVLFPLVTSCLLLAVWLMFGRLWPVVVTTISAAFAVLWTMGFSILREPTVNILMSILPTFVMIISFSDVVHMCSAYLLNLERGLEKDDAIVDATVEVGAACLLTSITTAIGFLAIAFAPAPSFQHLGVASAVGVLIAYGLAMILVPILLSLFPKPKAWHGGRLGAIQKTLDRLLRSLARFTSARPALVIAAFAVFGAVITYGSLQVEIETEFAERLDDDNPIRVDQRYLQERFVEASLIDVYVETAEEGAVLDPETFASLVAYEEELEALPEVEKVVSIVDLMRATHRSVVGEDAEFGPFTAEQLAQMMVLLEMQGPDALKPFVDFGRKTARLTVYSNIEGVVSQHALRQKFREIGRERLGEGATIVATGSGPLMGEWLDDIVAGQRRGLLFSLSVIALLLVLGFRSVRVGLVSMVPNVIPLLTAGAWCGFFWDTTDSDTLVVAMIAIGIGVDDTIHFISRYRLETTRNADRLAALRETFRYSGRGIFITTFVFVVGFLPMMPSDYFSFWAMGLLLPICFVVALVADLLLVPAMIRVGWIRFHS